MVTRKAELERGREHVSSWERKRRQKAAEGTEERGEKAASRTLSPACAGCAHLAAGASSPSPCGPSPRPRGLSCHQSSCRLRACKRLQQMWGGGGEGGGVPRGSSSQAKAQLCGIPTPQPCPHPHTYTRAHTDTHAHQTARQPTARPTLSQTRRGLLHLGTCFLTNPQSPLGGRDHSQAPS